MRHYEISPEERYDEQERHEREFSAEYMRTEDERADWARYEDAPQERE